MPRLIIDPEARDDTGTRRVRNQDIWRGTVEFDADTGASQDLDNDVAEQFADRYESFLLESEADQAPEEAPPLDDLDAVLDGTVDEAEDDLETGEYDDRLDELNSREAARDDRQGVHQAIDRRREAREAEAETEDEDEDAEE